MDATKTANENAAVAGHKPSRIDRRRKREMTSEDARYFLAKPGTSPERPELGQEIASEGEALVQAFRSGQAFYTLVAWRAVPEIHGGEPKIVKQALNRS